ncbi:hypothetical protein ACGFMO_15835 [Streptomyces niveus]|uniref:hypothetical protein n=1 Tax=Streptomyces niveus TaxID=193462 RepID=UPI00371A7ADF
MSVSNAAKPFLDTVDARQQALAEEIEQTRETITSLTGHLHELEERARNLLITRAGLLELADEIDQHDETGKPDDTPEPEGAANTTPTPTVPAHPAYQQIMAIFADRGEPLRSRDLCLELDLPVLAKHTEGIRSKLKRLVARGILTEPEPGLFTQPRL